MARPHGTKSIETPEKLLEYFEAYKKHTKDNPIRVQDYVGKDGSMVYREKERPLTIEGLQTWLFKNKIISTLQDYFMNRDGRYSDYVNVCHAIKNEIRQDQIEGGMAMIYNPSITQRLNGLAEKTETKGEHKLTVNADFNQIIQPPSESSEDTPLDKQ